MRVIPFLIASIFVILVVFYVGVSSVGAAPRSIESYKEELNELNPKATIYNVEVLKGAVVAEMFGVPIKEHELNSDFLVVAFSVCSSDSEATGAFFIAVLDDEGNFDEGYLLVMGKAPSTACGRVV